MTLPTAMRGTMKNNPVAYALDRLSKTFPAVNDGKDEQKQACLDLSRLISENLEPDLSGAKATYPWTLDVAHLLSTVGSRLADCLSARRDIFDLQVALGDVTTQALELSDAIDTARGFATMESSHADLARWEAARDRDATAATPPSDQATALERMIAAYWAPTHDSHSREKLQLTLSDIRRKASDAKVSTLTSIRDYKRALVTSPNHGYNFEQRLRRLRTHYTRDLRGAWSAALAASKGLELLKIPLPLPSPTTDGLLDALLGWHDDALDLWESRSSMRSETTLLIELNRDLDKQEISPGQVKLLKANSDPRLLAIGLCFQGTDRTPMDDTAVSFRGRITCKDSDTADGQTCHVMVSNIEAGAPELVQAPFMINRPLFGLYHFAVEGESITNPHYPADGTRNNRTKVADVRRFYLAARVSVAV